MLFKDKNNIKGVESFDPEKCQIEKERTMKFEKDNIAMGCSEGCFAGPIWTRPIK